MALTNVTLVPTSSGNYSCAISGTINTAQTGTGGGDHMDLAGYVSKCIIEVSNGATNSCSVSIEGSMDATNWITLAHRVDSATAYTTTANAVSAGTRELMFLAQGDWPRFVRANITVANANGVTIRLYAEK